MNYEHSTVLRLMYNAMLFTLLISLLSFAACEPEGYVVNLKATSIEGANLGCTQLKVYFRDKIQVLEGESCLQDYELGECILVVTESDTISMHSKLVGEWNFRERKFFDEEEYRLHNKVMYEDKYRKELDYSNESTYFDYSEGTFYSIAKLIASPTPNDGVFLFFTASCHGVLFVIEGELNNHSFEQAKELITSIKVK